MHPPRPCGRKSRRAEAVTPYRSLSTSSTHPLPLLNIPKPVLIPVALATFLVILEAGILAWQKFAPVSSAPVFSWREEPLLTKAPQPFGQALTLYRADRGAEQTKQLSEGRSLTVFYFEWDNIDLGPFSDVGGHSAEMCNVMYGSFKLLQAGAQRTHTFANGEKLCFNYTLLADPNGKQVHVYKIPWMQGFGMRVDPSKNRAAHIWYSLLHHRGAGRVLEAGLFGAASEDEAWTLFQREVLAKLQWSR